MHYLIPGLLVLSALVMSQLERESYDAHPRYGFTVMFVVLAIVTYFQLRP